ncbi:hypothetical protein MEQU1_001845 [Malassezia equina]|uniref:Major facilitator superfamily (MFS) profile domain-containing protein n=1 Tax=Malassezia equina TaxID=1381935 RepID=A0AAF0EDY2_9BASI|nr:hypothetical protein MEQU1_001845 [Malassezia equina]
MSAEPKMVDIVGPKDIEKKEDASTEALRYSHVEAAAVDEAYTRKVYVFNKIINEHIGMNAWQWWLLVVAGMGWFLDNAWLQLVALILPQVKAEFFTAPELDQLENKAAFLTLSLFTGMVVGATLWGYLADILGRRVSFNITLLICGVFGIAAGGAKSFAALAGLIGASCFGIGGSLPVDGMLFLEFLPGSHQYLLTLLSVSWSLGQLATSLIGWGFISGWNCEKHEACLDKYNSQGWLEMNVGWRYVIFTTGAYTLFCFFVRFIVFPLPESPKYYLANGRDAQAVQAMHKFAALCGKPLPEGMLTVATLRQAAGEPVEMGNDEVLKEPNGIMARCTSWVAEVRENVRHSKHVSLYQQIKPLFSSWPLGYTTAVTWLLWLLIGLAYPLFNSFIVTYLGSSGDPSLYKTYRNYVIISVCGVPGSVIGAWMVTWPRSGRRGAMAIGTILSGVFLFGFTGVGSDSDSQLAFFSVTNFFENIMYGVLYCYTPESFPAPLRGTADGVAAMLNRLMGVVATIIFIYSTSSEPPIYTSATLFIVSGLLMLTLRVETAARTSL